MFITDPLDDIPELIGRFSGRRRVLHHPFEIVTGPTLVSAHLLENLVPEHVEKGRRPVAVIETGRKDGVGDGLDRFIAAGQEIVDDRNSPVLPSSVRDRIDDIDDYIIGRMTRLGVDGPKRLRAKRWRSQAAAERADTSTSSKSVAAAKMRGPMNRSVSQP